MLAAQAQVDHFYLLSLREVELEDLALAKSMRISPLEDDFRHMKVGLQWYTDLALVS
jgi:hypothetical protein